ncbi:MAG: DUF1800 family protein [Anaerolineales bacterium]
MDATLIARVSSWHRAIYFAQTRCWLHFSDNPPDSVVEAAASVFMANLTAPDQLKRVVETILLSPEFKQTWGAKIKRPIEAAISMMRAVNTDFTKLPGGIAWMCGMMGQAMFERRPPDGYPM